MHHLGDLRQLEVDATAWQHAWFKQIDGTVTVARDFPVDNHAWHVPTPRAYRERQKQRQRDRERQRQWEIMGDTERDREGEREPHRQRDRETETERQTEK
jgi:hypothetical protein